MFAKRGQDFDTDKKALATLKQLTDKGFLQSHKTSLQGKGDVRLFQPSVQPVYPVQLKQGKQGK